MTGKGLAVVERDAVCLAQIFILRCPAGAIPIPAPSILGVMTALGLKLPAEASQV
jgi:hypothetical protein